jgi:D-alanyl-D-alanine-carboxypeptidase/D-alanyl-D-alanine-endopeptidase
VVLLGITLGIGLREAPAQDRLLQETVEFTGGVLFLEHKVPGLVIGAIRGAERALGLRRDRQGNGRYPGERSVFRIGSVTKAFTGEVLASLVAGSTLKLTDPLEKHLGWDVSIPNRGGNLVRLVDLATPMLALLSAPVGGSMLALAVSLLAAF